MINIFLLSSFKKAFDSVSDEILIKYLQNRKQFVSINNFKTKFEPVRYGVPQASILEPLLFLLYINNLPVSLNTMPRLFADGTTLLIHESSFSKMEGLVNSELTNISKWMIPNRLTLHPNKILAINASPFFFCIWSAPQLDLTLDNVKIKKSISCEISRSFTR